MSEHLPVPASTGGAPGVEATCHCGAVRIALAYAPAQVTSCNCSICRRTGWLVAYYGLAEVRVAGETDTYVWGDRMLAFHRCKVCGCGTHWSPLGTPTLDRMGVNARLLPPDLLAQARVHRFDGAETWTTLGVDPAPASGEHDAFTVSGPDFEAILDRIRAAALPHGPRLDAVDANAEPGSEHGARSMARTVHLNDPNGHLLEIRIYRS